MNYPGERVRFGLGGQLTPMVKYLIIINIVVFILQHIFDGPNVGNFTYYLGLRPDFLQNFYIWQVVTYMFLHGGVFHIFINMLLLWIFGSEVEGTWGSRAFLKYYLICGIGAGVIQALFNTFIFPSNNIIVGASGAIYGLLLAFALIDPEREITFLLLLVLPIRMKAKYLAMLFAGFALFAGLFSGDGDNVAHFAHLGGMLVGYLYLKVDWRTEAIGNWFQRKRASRDIVRQAKRRQQEMRLRETVDEILDKINEVGYANLTDEEKAILKRASQYLNKQEEQE